MPIVIIILLLVVIVGLAASLDTPKSTNILTTKTDNGFAATVQRQMGRFRQALMREANLLKGPRHALTKPFMQWVSANFEHEPAVRDWLLGLNEGAQHKITEKLVLLFQDVDLELGWLVSGDLEEHPALQQVAQDVVTHYTQALWAVSQEKATIRAFRHTHHVER